MGKVAGKSILKALIEEISSISEENTYLLQNDNNFYLIDDYEDLFMNVVIKINDEVKYQTLLNEVLDNNIYNKFSVLRLKEGFKGKNIEYNAITKLNNETKVNYFDNIKFIMSNNEKLMECNDLTMDEFKHILEDKNFYNFDNNEFTSLKDIDIENNSYIKILLFAKDFGKLLFSGKVSIELYDYKEDLYLVHFKVNNNSYLDVHYYGFILSD